jgi:hypothetical protein
MTSQKYRTVDHYNMTIYNSGVPLFSVMLRRPDEGVFHCWCTVEQVLEMVPRLTAGDLSPCQLAVNDAIRLDEAVVVRAQ